MKYIALLLASATLAVVVSHANAQTTHEVLTMDFEFVPQNVDAAPGDTIRWLWVNGIHTATEGSGCNPTWLFHASVDQFNPVFEWTVPADQVEPGQVINYICLPHCAHGMFGTITIEQTGIVGDLNDDGVVDVSDLLILLGGWGPCPFKVDCPADLNGDNAVDVSDLLMLLGNWG